MPAIVTCPAGHPWSPTANGSKDQSAAPPTCPVCGAPMPAAAPPAEAPTLPPPSEPDRPDLALAETMAPATPGERPAAAPAPFEEADLYPTRAPDAPADLPAAGEGWPGVAGYEILSVLGRGGMGVVYKARHLQLKRLVALKMILAGGHAGGDELARFRTEAEAVARLQHPHIVQIHEVGEQDGLPYFSLEFVDGGSLAQKLNGTPLTPREAAAIVETLARAMQAAHQKGIIHRDLKPANVLLTADGAPKITDFGLAKKLDDVSGRTASGVIMGTPSYMAPEQAGGQKQIGPAADIYALGAILYECLTGRPPFKAATSLDTVLQVVAEEPVPPRRLQPRLPADLETICLKCLHKDPLRRYATAEDLAEDLHRFLMDEPIRARPVGWVERGLKWARRRPALAALAVVTVVFAACLLIGGVWFNAQVQVALTEAEDERAAAAAANHQVGQLRDEAEYERTEARQLLDRAVRRNQYHAQFHAARLSWENGQVLEARDLLQGLRPEKPGAYDFRGFEWYYLWNQCHTEQAALRGHRGQILGLAYSPDGKLLASAGQFGEVFLWDPEAARVVRTLRGHRGEVYEIDFRPDGKQLATAGEEHEVKVWDAETGRELFACRGHTNQLRSVAYSPDGKRLASVGLDKAVKVWDADTGKELLNCTGLRPPAASVCFSRDGRWLAAGDNSGRVTLWDAARGGTPTRTLRGHTAAIERVTFSPDGKVLASASRDYTVKLWEAETGKERHALKGHAGHVRGLAFSPDGKSLATASQDKTVKVWDSDSGEERFTLRGHIEGLNRVVFHPHGRHLASAGIDGVIRLWDAGADPQARTLSGAMAFTAFSSDGRYLATLGTTFLSLRIKILEMPSGREVQRLSGFQGEVTGLAFSPDGRQVAACGVDQAIHIWDRATGRQVRTYSKIGTLPIGLAFHPSGRRVATGGQDGVVSVWDASPAGPGREADPPLQRLRGHSNRVTRVAYSPDGRRLASASSDGSVRVWEADSGQGLRMLQGHQGPVLTVAFSPDSQTLASGGVDRTVRIWEVDTGREIRRLVGHSRTVWALAFSPNGRRLASVSGEIDFTLGAQPFLPGEQKVWDVVTGMELLSLKGHATATYRVAFSPDGQHLATGSMGQVHTAALKLWEAPVPTYPDTGNWPILFADDFNRVELGERWRPENGRWSIADGGVRGEVGPNPKDGKWDAARLSLNGFDLPETVEIRYDTWTPSPVVHSDIRLIDPRTESGLVGVLINRPVPFPQGAALLATVQNSTEILGRNNSFGFQPNRRYRCRLLRHAGWLTLFVDDVEVVSARVFDGEAPQLNLKVSFDTGASPNQHVGGTVGGPTGLVLYFGNLEIRAPADAVHRRQLRSRIETLTDRLLLGSEVRAELQRDATLTEADRAFADKVLKPYREDPKQLFEASLSVVTQPSATPAAYILALRQAEAAHRMDPENLEYRETLGLAQFRAGRDKDAVVTLTRADQLRRERTGVRYPRTLAALAMAYFRLGNKDAAREHLMHLRDTMRSIAWSSRPSAQAYMKEAMALVGNTLPQDEAFREEERLKDLVVQGEEAGWLRHDLTAYLDLFTDDFHGALGRGPQPDSHDVTFDRARLQAVRRVRFRGPPPNLKILTTANQFQVQREGDQVTLHLRSAIGWEDGHESYEGVYRLRRTPNGWKVFNQRSWYVDEAHQGTRVVYDPATYARLDELRSKGDQADLVKALDEAHRPREAHEVAKELTRAAPDNAAWWALRGEMAVKAHQGADAWASFRKALNLDPEVKVPFYMSRELRSLAGNEKGATGVVFSADGRQLVSAGADQTVRVWEAETGKPVRTLGGHQQTVTRVARSADGTVWASSSTDGTVRLWDLAGGKELAVLPAETRLEAVAVSPDGRYLAAAEADPTVPVWDVASRQRLHTLQGHAAVIWGVAFSLDGSRLASTDNAGVAKIWDVVSGKELRSWQAHGKSVGGVAFSPDGRLLATAGDDHLVKLWEADTGKELRVLKGHHNEVWRVVFRPDGRQLATAGTDETARVWETDSGRQLLCLRGHRGTVAGVAFSPDGSRLATAGFDATVRLWDIRPMGDAPP